MRIYIKIEKVYSNIKMLRSSINILEEHGISYKDNTNEYMKEYMRQNNGVKISCECGKMVAKGMLKRHRGTNFHIKNPTSK